MIKNTSTMRTRSLMLVLVSVFTLFTGSLVAQTPNEQQARRFFDKVPHCIMM